MNLAVSPDTSTELLSQVREFLIKIPFPWLEVLLRFVHRIALITEMPVLLPLTCRVVYIVHKHLVAVAIVR